MLCSFTTLVIMALQSVQPFVALRKFFLPSLINRVLPLIHPWLLGRLSAHFLFSCCLQVVLCVAHFPKPLFSFFPSFWYYVCEHFVSIFLETSSLLTFSVHGSLTILFGEPYFFCFRSYFHAIRLPSIHCHKLGQILHRVSVIFY